jgi:copper chaperone NosL
MKAWDEGAQGLSEDDSIIRRNIMKAKIGREEAITGLTGWPLPRFGKLAMACFLFCLLLAQSAGAMEKGVSARTAPPSPKTKDKCPVCGMFVAKYPDWTTVILFKDGSHAFFDGAKDLFKYLFDMKRYDPAKSAADVKTVFVKDYYRLSLIDAKTAWYVLGSDVYGPMGRELIPMEKEADAREFLNDHRGKKILRYGDVTREVIKSLD